MCLVCENNSLVHMLRVTQSEQGYLFGLPQVLPLQARDFAPSSSIWTITFPRAALDLFSPTDSGKNLLGSSNAAAAAKYVLLTGSVRRVYPLAAN